MVKAAALFAVASIAVLGCVTNAPASCATPVPKGFPCPTEPWETVGLEHRDRVGRLRRLSAGRPGFEFREDVVSRADHQLSHYPTDIPVLRVIANQDVFFDSGSPAIRREARPMLEMIAESLRREPPDFALFIAGHTDWDGPDDYNMDLGYARAVAVSEALIVLGINHANIHRVSFGEHLPIADNRAALGRARNRRVEFLFAARAQAIVPYIEKQHVEFCSKQTGDAADACRKELIFTVERIQIPLEHQKEVVEIERESREIEIAATRGVPPVEIERRRREIEFRRERIPIEISNEKIYIEFGDP
jgi:outer membrane protein OmpA-like peptidoglycan-associated protein